MVVVEVVQKWEDTRATSQLQNMDALRTHSLITQLAYNKSMSDQSADVGQYVSTSSET